MALPLPYAGKIKPPQWTNTLNTQTMQTGSLKLKLPIGLKPVTRATTLEWTLETVEQALEIIQELESKAYNGTYIYVDNVEGEVYLRPTGDSSYTEPHPGLPCFFNAGFEKL